MPKLKDKNLFISKNIIIKDIEKTLNIIEIVFVSYPIIKGGLLIFIKSDNKFSHNNLFSLFSEIILKNVAFLKIL